jgi:hypothetical protein
MRHLPGIMARQARFQVIRDAGVITLGIIDALKKYRRIS